MTDEIAGVSIAFRNPVFNSRGTIDLEILVGDVWGPFTADPADIVPYGRELYAAAIAGTVARYVPPTVEQARAGLPDLSRKQFRLGMRDLGVSTAMIDSAIAAIADEDAREVAQIEWEDSASYSRMHPIIAQLAGAFSLTDEQIDNAWQQALNYL